MVVLFQDPPFLKEFSFLFFWKCYPTGFYCHVLTRWFKLSFVNITEITLELKKDFSNSKATSRFLSECKVKFDVYILFQERILSVKRKALLLKICFVSISINEPRTQVKYWGKGLSLNGNVDIENHYKMWTQNLTPVSIHILCEPIVVVPRSGITNRIGCFPFHQLLLQNRI